MEKNRGLIFSLRKLGWNWDFDPWPSLGGRFPRRHKASGQDTFGLAESVRVGNFLCRTYLFYLQIVFYNSSLLVVISEITSISISCCIYCMYVCQSVCMHVVPACTHACMGAWVHGCILECIMLRHVVYPLSVFHFESHFESNNLNLQICGASAASFLRTLGFWVTPIRNLVGLSNSQNDRKSNPTKWVSNYMFYPLIV